MRFVSILLMSLACACAASVTPRSAPTEALEPETLEPSVDGNFSLYVTNQSFDRPTVDIGVSIDGLSAVSQDFDVENQHNWVEFRFDLEPGTHELEVTSRDDGSTLARDFKTEDENWAVVSYWCCDPSDDQPKFTFQISDEPVGFD